MSYEIKFADVGEGVHEGEVLELFVSEGEKVDVEQELLEVFTEKVTTEITSPVEGEIEQILFKVGDTIKVGQTLFLIKTESNNSNSEIVESLDLDDYKLNEIEEDPSLFKPSTPDSSITRRRSSPENVVVPNDSLSATNINKVLAPPAVRRRAREHNIDLSYVTGTGPAGRIKQIDLDHYINANETNINGSKDQMLPSKSIDSPITNEEENRVKLKGTRKTIAKYMRLSKDQAAHYTYFDEVDMTNLDSLRNQLRSKMEENDIKVTYVSLVMKCLIPALKKFPILNSQLDMSNEEIIYKNYYNIGISVDTNDGLVVPVIKDVDKKSIWEIAREIKNLAEKARAGKLDLNDVSNGTFTLTSVGNIGGMMATPIINQPESAILGLLKAKKRPIVINENGEDKIAIRNIMYLSLSLDHRIVDGAVGARFLNEVIKFMENPALIWV